MPEPSSKREKLYGDAYRRALGGAPVSGDYIEVSRTEAKAAARARRRQQKADERTTQKRRVEGRGPSKTKSRKAEKRQQEKLAAQELARESQAQRAETKRQIREWDALGLDAKPKAATAAPKSRLGNSRWVPVYQGGAPGLGKRS